MPEELKSEFITNEEGNTLSARLRKIVPKTENLDVLVGYFYISGFYQIYKTLESVDEVRILIGINTEKKVSDIAQGNLEIQYDSAKKIKDEITKKYVEEVAYADDEIDVEEGMLKFLEWLKNGKLKMRIYDKSPLHAKLYIFTFKEEIRDIDKGRVITGSSNLTRSGLSENLEFNVELKDSEDYEYAKKSFDRLWTDSIEISEGIRETIEKKTHLNDEITPYQLYLKFLYEYFKEDLSEDTDVEDYIPEGYLELEYQKQAVVNAKKILEEYGGVFISDVVGLGKTYITARLLNSIDGKTLVLASPALISKDNPGSWENVLRDFGVRGYDCRSIGILERILEGSVDSYKNVVIDESHNFRNEATISFERLAEICKGKRVILVSATPFNNQPKDLLAQIKLFQNSRKSTIPGVTNLEAYFSALHSRIRKLDRKKDYEEYMSVIKENAQSIRENILKYLMVRRTRTEIEKYYKKDLEKQGLKFPEVKDPDPIYYQFDEKEDEAFNKTLSFITDFKYSRYIPLLYYTGELTAREKISQKNMLTFMKMLLLKRFESSIYAFRQTLQRFIRSYELMIEQFDDGNVYVSRKNAGKVFRLLEENRIEEIMDLVEDEKVEYYESKYFEKSLRADLEYDLELLRNLSATWSVIDRDIKLETFVERLKDDLILKNNKLIIFTESKETAEYLSKELEKRLGEEILNYTGGSTESLRREVISNFDARANNKKDDYRILVTTEVLAEGVNLHQSNVVINYDIPWNPTRLMQRVGRINRVDTKFDKIYTYNFFPSVQSNDLLRLKEAAEAKIRMFIELLGNDARLLTEGEEIKSNELFDKLTSKETIMGEEEEDTELKYLSIIKEIRDENVKLFAEVKKLPKKSRSARKMPKNNNKLLTYFKKGKLDKFVISSKKDEAAELGFLDAIKLFECEEDTKREDIPEDFYKRIEENKKLFDILTSEEIEAALETRTGAIDRKILKRLNSKTVRFYEGFTESEEEYIELIKQKIDDGALPKMTAKRIWKKMKTMEEPLKMLRLLQKEISDNLLKETYAEANEEEQTVKEVILSEYFK